LEGRRVVFSMKEEIRREGHSFFYCESGEEIRILTIKGFSAVTGVGHGGEMNFSPEHYMSFKNTDDKGVKIEWKEQFFQKCKSDIRMMINVCESVLKNPVPSSDESFLVIYLHEKVVHKICAWANGQQNPMQLTSFGLFMQEIREQINSTEIKLPNGRVMDPRGFTIFLLNIQNFPVVECPADTLTWTLGTPPIQGRAVHARQHLQNEMKKVANRVANAQELIGLDKIVGDIKLEANEQEIFDELVKYDQTIAMESRDKGYLHFIPINTIDKNVDSFVYRVQSRLDDTFSMGVTFPTLKMFQTEWKESYQPHLQRIDEMIALMEESKRLDDERKAKEKLAKEREEELEKAKHEEQLAKLAQPPQPELEGIIELLKECD